VTGAAAGAVERRHGGPGLGPAITKRRSARKGGDVRVEAPGAGSIFTLTLPATVCGTGIAAEGH
jgi:signal transduction histidine kinase